MKKLTIIIPTRNRKEVLFKTLKNLQKLNEPKPEIMVYDDNSEEDYSLELEKAFPEVNFRRSSVRLGPCELRNRMIKEAAGGFIIGLDDDSYFLDIMDYIEALKIIENSPKIGLIGFKIITKDGVQFPSGLKEGSYGSACFMTCGFIARKETILKAGGFDPLLLRAGEERDLAIRILDEDLDLLQDNEIEVFHELSDYERVHQFIHGYAFRNELFFYLKYFPTILCPLFIFKCIIGHTIFCFSRLWFKAYFFGISRFILDFEIFAKKRRPVKFSTAKKYLLLNFRNKN